MSEATEADNSSHKLWLDPIPESLRDCAIKALEERCVESFLLLAPNNARLWLLLYNLSAIQATGRYEEALYLAYTETRSFMKFRHWFNYVFQQADPEKLRRAGSEIPQTPEAGFFVAYRGISGKTNRYVRGYSWTASSERAKWFATRFNLPNPAVYQGLFLRAHILFYTNDRDEQEFVVRPQFMRIHKVKDLSLIADWAPQ